MLVLTNRLQHRGTAPPPVITPKTYQYGQWLFPLGGSDSHANISALYTSNIKGFVKRIAWNSMEAGGGTGPAGTSPGSYDFSEITSDLVYCAAHVPPLYMIVLIEDKSFSGGTNMLPAYLDTETWVNGLGNTITGYEFPNPNPTTGPGKATLRWKQRVVDRYIALVTAMAAQFDDPTVGNNRYFLGYCSQETAVGSGVAVAKYDYSANDYRDSYKQTIRAGSNAFRYSYVHWMFNFLQGNNSYMSQIGQYFASPVNCPNQNVIAGGPDMKPWDGTLNGTGDAFTQYDTIMNYGITAAKPLGTSMFCTFSDPCYDGSDLSTHTPHPHKTVNVYSTIAATTALQVSATATVGGKLQITVPCTNAQSVTGVNPYSVDEVVQLDDGTNTVNVTVQSISGSSGSYKAVFTTNPAPPSGSWVGSTASRFWTFTEYYVWGTGLATGTPDFPAHAVIHLRSIWWYPTGSVVYDWDNGTSPGGTDGKSFVNANPTIWP